MPQISRRNTDGQDEQRLRPAMYVENDRQDRSDALIRYIDSLGYDMYWHTPPLYNPRNFLSNPQNVFGNANTLRHR